MKREREANPDSNDKGTRSKMPSVWQAAVSFTNGDLSFRESFACILFPSPASRLAKLDLVTLLNITKYVVGTGFGSFIQADSLYLGVANSYLSDNHLTHEAFKEYETSAYKVSHIKVAAEFMAEVIIKIHLEDFLRHRQSALLGFGHYQLEDLLYTTLIYRAAEFDWHVCKEFRQGIMHVTDKTLLIQSARGNEKFDQSIRNAVDKCITNWVKRLTASRAELPQEEQLAQS